MIDRDKYFSYVRDVLFEGALSQQQVDGQNVLLALWDYQATGTPMTDPRWLAYILATTFHETAFKMWPVVEQGSDDYLEGKEYYPYVGRGFVQLTWEENYRSASAALGLIEDRDLVTHPDLALDSLISARVLFRGMAEGWFTTRKLGQYFNEEENDPVNARQIINGNDKDTTIAAYYSQFLSAIEEATVADWPEPQSPTQNVSVAIDADEGVQVQVIVNGVPFAGA